MYISKKKLVKSLKIKVKKKRYEVEDLQDIYEDTYTQNIKFNTAKKKK